MLAYRVYEPRSVLRTQWWKETIDSQKFSDLHICAVAFVFPCPISSKLKQPSEDEVTQQVGLGRVWSLAWSARPAVWVVTAVAGVPVGYYSTPPVNVT